MDRRSGPVADLLAGALMEQPRELRQLFHQLNNQLGIILAHAAWRRGRRTRRAVRARLRWSAACSTQWEPPNKSACRWGRGLRKPDYQSQTLRAARKYPRERSKALLPEGNCQIPSLSFHLHHRRQLFGILRCAELQLVTPKNVIRNCHDFDKI